MKAKNDDSEEGGFFGFFKNNDKKEEKQEEKKMSVSVTPSKPPPPKPETPTEADFVFRNYYYNTIDIDIGEGFKMMKDKFDSSWNDDQSALTVLKCPMPLGMVVNELKSPEGRKKGIFEILEVEEGSNAEKAGIRVGDAFRACNATVQKQVRDATAFIEADTQRTKALFVADGKPFDTLMGAIATNAGEGSITMVLERRKPDGWAPTTYS